MKKPTVSIIMSTYNDALYIEKALKSVVNQTYTDWEFIIVDDASTDETKNIVKKFVDKDKRIKLISNKVNQGLVKNLITGVNLTKGEYIARIDGDDRWIDKKKLKKQLNFLSIRPEYGLVGSWAKIVNEDDKVLCTSKNPVTDDEIRNYLLIENCFFHSSIIMRKSILTKIGNYNTTIRTAEDYNLWLRIGLVSKMYIMPEYLINYRINPQGTSATKYNLQLAETIGIIKDFKEYYPNYTIALVLWKLRKFTPKKIRLFASCLLKNEKFVNNVRALKKLLLSLHYGFAI